MRGIWRQELANACEAVDGISLPARSTGAEPQKCAKCRAANASHGTKARAFVRWLLEARNFDLLTHFVR